MTNSVLLQPAYVLHARAYRDTSLLLDLFTPEHGRVNAIARSARGARSRFKGILQPLQPLVVSWYGKTDLMSLTLAETSGIGHTLSGEALVCALYLNELLVRLLHRYDAHPKLYAAYQTALTDLQQENNLQPALRLFEKQLLLELGYALQLNYAVDTQKNITPDQFYYFNPLQGLSCSNNAVASPNVFSGESLLALHADNLTTENTLRDAKRLLRIALNQLLENKPIRSRELFLVKN
jgi:DNA repair protein RecO (recombination protein O)